MVYNITNITASRGMLGLAQNTQSALGGYFIGWSILLMIFVVVFVVLLNKNYKMSGAFSASCWFVMMISWFLRAMSLIDNATLWSCVFLAVGSIFILFLSDN